MLDGVAYYERAIRLFADMDDAQGELVALFEDWQLDPMPLYIKYPPNRHVSAKLLVFIDWVAALMQEHVPTPIR